MHSFTWICPGNWFCGLIMCSIFPPHHLQSSIILNIGFKEKTIKLHVEI